MASTSMPTLIQNLLLARVTAVCQTAVIEGDPSRAQQVTLGRFQDDPTDYGVIIRIHRNDPFKTERSGVSGWPDERAEPLEMGNAVIGGASPEYWMRRFSIVCHVWPVGKVQVEAQTINDEVVNRVRHAVTSYVIPGDTADDFGESIIERTNPVVRMITDEGGGPDDEYSWKTTLYLQYMTYIRPQGV